MKETIKAMTETILTFAPLEQNQIIHELYKRILQHRTEQVTEAERKFLELKESLNTLKI